MKHVHRFFAVVMILTLLIIGKGVTAFADSTLILPADLKIIEARAFYGDTSIDQVVLQDGVEEIKSLAFANSSLRSINLPNTLTYIADNAFQGSAHVNMTAQRGTYSYDWAVDHGYIDESLPSVQCLTEGVVFNALTQAQIDAADSERNILRQKGPADYFGIKEIKCEEVSRLDAIDADIGPDANIEDNKVEIAILTGLPFAAGDALIVLLAVNGEGGGITWTYFNGVAGDNGEIVVMVDVDVLDNASLFACGLA